jgi:hypothetical protein
MDRRLVAASRTCSSARSSATARAALSGSLALSKRPVCNHDSPSAISASGRHGSVPGAASTSASNIGPTAAITRSRSPLS